ncbi:hypothetical protein [Sulfurimonas sp.]
MSYVQECQGDHPNKTKAHVISTSPREDIRLAQSIDVKYSLKDLQELVNIVFENRNVPLNDVFVVLRKSGYDLVEENDVDVIMLWLKQVFNQRNLEL